MSSPLSEIDVEKRRQVAATLGLFAMLFIAIGAVAATGAATAVIKGFVAVALLVAVVLGLLAWGVLRSIKLDLADQRLDATIESAVRASGRSMCDCGHEHDPDEMHIVGDDRGHFVGDDRGHLVGDDRGHLVDGEGQHVSGTTRRAAAAQCAHDGAGAECAHSCDTCVLATMRPLPNRTRAERLGHTAGAAPSNP
ncbi:MAG: hypothetical protein QOH89_3761 [Pseudonocardiales bacterium]|nr:hypothetical protein [Pseudonocardiales bacterium]